MALVPFVQTAVPPLPVDDPDAENVPPVAAFSPFAVSCIAADLIKRVTHTYTTHVLFHIWMTLLRWFLSALWFVPFLILYAVLPAVVAHVAQTRADPGLLVTYGVKVAKHAPTYVLYAVGRMGQQLVNETASQF